MNSLTQRLEKRFRENSGPLYPLQTGEEPQLKPLTGIRFLVFDFYGTLFISGVGDIGIDEDSQDALTFRAALEACGLESGKRTADRGFRLYEEKVEEQCEAIRAMGIDTPEPDIRNVWLDVLLALKEEELISQEADMDLACLFSVEYESRMNPVWPMPGYREALEGIRKKNLPVGIISNSQFYTPVAFRALSGSSLSDLGFHEGLLHWSFEEQMKKPAADFYDGFLRKLEKTFPAADPSSVLYVGNDMLKDIYPAAGMGMRTALFAGDSRSLKWRREDPRCSSLQPDLVVTDLEQLPECII